jgi:uncharacterized membrane protein
MKIGRILFVVILVGLLGLSPVSSVFAQDNPNYEMTLTPSDGLYNTTIIAGQARDFRADLENIGDEPITKISFSGSAPEGWTLKFDPTRIASLAPFGSERVYANISVPEKTAPGDYLVSFSASGDQASTEKIEVRVTVRTAAVEESIEMRAVHPRVDAIAGQNFVFEIEFKYTGQVLGEPRAFNLNPTAPPNWEAYLTPQFEKDKQISAIDLKPGGMVYGDTTRLVATAPAWPLPEPGEYTITLEAVSGDLKATLDVTAVITARYQLVMAPSGQRYNTNATAGRDNHFSIDMGNLGTAPIDKIDFTSDNPEGWDIDFIPDRVDSLEALSTRTVDINIKPPPDTIAGDYIVSLRASGVQATSQKMDVRVTVETPTVWGWVGVVILVLVISGLVVVFMRFSRR